MDESLQVKGQQCQFMELILAAEETPDSLEKNWIGLLICFLDHQVLLVSLQWNTDFDVKRVHYKHFGVVICQGVVCQCHIIITSEKVRTNALRNIS